MAPQGVEKQLQPGDLSSSLGADDPFYPRQGKALTWTGVNMTVVRGKFCVEEQFQLYTKSKINLFPLSIGGKEGRQNYPQ